MEIRTRATDGVDIIELAGDLDSRSAPDLQEAVLPLLAGGPDVLIDLAGVAYLSSAGLRALLLIYRQVETEHGAVALVGLSPQLRDVLSTTGFLDFFQVRDTVAAGCEALRVGSARGRGVQDGAA